MYSALWNSVPAYSPCDTEAVSFERDQSKGQAAVPMHCHLGPVK